MAATLIHLLKAQLCPSPLFIMTVKDAPFSAHFDYKLGKTKTQSSTSLILFNFQAFKTGSSLCCVFFFVQQLKMKKHSSAEKKDNIEKPLAQMPPPPKLERKPSIDAEPKTLLQEEMKVAREAALKIINSHSKEEALKIFLTGLVPVGASSKQVKEDVVVSDCDDDDE